MSTEQSFECFSGNDIVLQITATDENNNGDPLDLTGATNIIWALAKRAGAAALITKTLLTGVSVVNPVLGSIEVTLDASDLEPLKGEYYHELRLTNSLGKKITLMFGTATIAENLIRT